MSRDKSPVGIRARLLGIKILHRDETLCVIRCPSWMPEEALERVATDGRNALAALGGDGSDVVLTRRGRYFRIERRADALLERQLRDA